MSEDEHRAGGTTITSVAGSSDPAASSSASDEDEELVAPASPRKPAPSAPKGFGELSDLLSGAAAAAPLGSRRTRGRN